MFYWNLYYTIQDINSPTFSEYHTNSHIIQYLLMHNWHVCQPSFSLCHFRFSWDPVTWSLCLRNRKLQLQHHQQLWRHSGVGRRSRLSSEGEIQTWSSRWVGLSGRLEEFRIYHRSFTNCWTPQSHNLLTLDVLQLDTKDTIK